MNSLPIDCVKVFLGYLPFQDLKELGLTCKSWRNVCTHDKQTLIPLLLAILQPAVTLTPDRFLLDSLECWDLLLLLEAYSQHLAFRNIGYQVLAVSSMERWDESGTNLLGRRVCCSRMLRDVTHDAFMSRRQDFCRDLFVAQSRCRCAYSRACYWGSAPSPRDDIDEFSVVNTIAPVCLLTAVTIVPYTATWQPDSPTFGPKEIIIEVLKPKRTPRVYPAMPGPLNRVNNYRLSGSSSQFPEDDILFRSQAFLVPNSPVHHTYALENPVLVVAGQIRVIFRGMHQRQPIEGNDNYYLCLSPMTLWGTVLPLDVQWRNESDDDWQVDMVYEQEIMVLGESERLRTANELGCILPSYLR